MKSKQSNDVNYMKAVSNNIHTFDSLIRAVVAETLTEASKKSGKLNEDFKANINLELSLSFEKCLTLCHNGKCVIVCPSVDTRPAIFQDQVFIE